MLAFSLERVVGNAALGAFQTPHGQQHSQIALLVPHQGGTKQSRRFSHSTYSWTTPRGRFPAGARGQQDVSR